MKKENQIMKELEIESNRISKWINSDEESVSCYYFFISYLLANSNLTDLELIGILEKIKLDLNNALDNGK